ncbi:MAG: nucleoside-triphosphatase [Oscillospiraceae bacterium]|jgi:nucleoside-triphosphatase|nr:nucleoside-triphosphatase [Oscillospiraceae bacterium]
MARHIFLTGEIQVGKSTAIRRFLGNTGVAADGFVSRIVPARGRRELYLARFDTERGETGKRLAAVIEYPRKRVFGEVFDTHGTEIVASSGKRRLIILDELGVLEECSPIFKAAVIRQLDGAIPALGVLKKADGAFLDSIRARPDVELVTVTAENRDEIPELLYRRFAAV